LLQKMMFPRSKSRYDKIDDWNNCLRVLRVFMIDWWV
jgi:hypothetical protein